MKVLLVTYTPTKPGGLNRAALMIAEGLSDFADVSVASIGYHGEPKGDIKPDLYPVRFSIDDSGLVRAEWADIDTAVAYSEPDHMILLGDPWMFGGVEQWVANPSGRVKKIPAIMLWMTIDSGPFPEAMRDTHVLDIPEALACTTQFGCDVLKGTAKLPWGVKSSTKYRSNLIELGVDKERFYPRDVKKTDDRIWIGWCGRNDNRKLAPYALRALQIMKEEDTPAMLWMRTEAVDCFDIPAISEMLGLRCTYKNPTENPNADVYIVGDKTRTYTPIDDEGMARYYSMCDIMLHTAVAGAPELPILEARACGTPVIASDAYSNRAYADIVLPTEVAWVTNVNTMHASTSPELYAYAIKQWWLECEGKKRIRPDIRIPSWDETIRGLKVALQAPVCNGPYGVVV